MQIFEGRTWLELSFIILAAPFAAGFGSGAQHFLHDTQHVLQEQTNTPDPLRCLEVAAPVVKPEARSSPCLQVIMEHSFSNSYGQPFVGRYKPPRCIFNRVTMNLTVEAAGRQFDRLAIMYLSDTEIWRTSTAEPSASGIVWTYTKDATPFLSLWQRPQTVIFDLGNIVNDIYTAPFNTTLTLNFFNTNHTDALVPADSIIPISARRSGGGEPSAFRIPEDRAVTAVALPKNATKAIVSLAACGQMAEEFWWSNVPDSTKLTFGADSELLAHSPFREVQLLIDGKLAGVAWPFPVIFTGGVAPGFWRPVVGIDAFDLHEYEIDISPWIPVLTDGKDHRFEIRVVGLSDDGLGNAELGPVGSYWVVSGKVFLWHHSNGPFFPGLLPVITAPEPDIFVTSNTDSTNSTLKYEVIVQRQLSVRNQVHGSDREKGSTEWYQRLSYSNIGDFRSSGNVQSNAMVVAGTEVSTGTMHRRFTYPLQATTEVKVNDDSQGFSINATLDFSKNVQLIGSSVFPSPIDSFDGRFGGWLVTNRQNGSAYYFKNGSRSGSGGSTEQDFVIKGLKGIGHGSPGSFQEGIKLYSRHVLASNNSIVADSESDVMWLVRGENDIEFAPIPLEGVVSGKVRKSSEMWPDFRKG